MVFWVLHREEDWIFLHLGTLPSPRCTWILLVFPLDTGASSQILFCYGDFNFHLFCVMERNPHCCISKFQRFLKILQVIFLTFGVT